MVEVHNKGKGIAGIYDFQIAETKIYETMMSAKEHAYPLLVTGEINE
jgi:ATP-dependent Clp protease adaptor protein ClpS